MPVRAIGLGLETTYGQDVALTKFISAIDEGIGEDNGIISEEEMGQRGQAKPVLGSFKAGGPFKFYLEPENAGLLLKALLGAVTSTLLVTGEYSHVFTPGNTAVYLTSAVITGLTAAQRTYPGTCIKKIKLSLAPGQKCLVEVDIDAKTINLDTLASPTFSTKDPFVFHQGSAKIATAANADIKAMTIEIEPHWGEEDYTIGSRTKRKAPLQGITVKGTMDILFDSKAQLELFLGTAAATEPATIPPTKQQLDLVIDTGVVIATVNTYKITISLKECLYKTSKENVNKQERIIQNLEFEAYVPASGSITTITLQNSEASY